MASHAGIRDAAPGWGVSDPSRDAHAPRTPQQTRRGGGESTSAVQRSPGPPPGAPPPHPSLESVLRDPQLRTVGQNLTAALLEEGAAATPWDTLAGAAGITV